MLLVLGLWVAPGTMAEEPLSATATVPGRIAATDDEDASAAASGVPLRERPTPVADLGSAVLELPGTRVRSAGGLGGFSGLSLRGAELDHTAVLIDTIAVTSPDGGAFDLGTLPPELFDRLVVYRGGVPLWFDQGAVGGVLRLIPGSARRRRARVQASAGSFGAVSLGASSEVAGEEGHGPRFFSHVGLARSDDDYPYLDDGTTRFVEKDDRIARQRNAGIEQASGLGHGSVGLGPGRLSVLGMAHGRLQGVPGPLAQPSEEVHRKLVRGLLAVQYRQQARDGDGERRQRLELTASAVHARDQLYDRVPELGVGNPVASDDALWRLQLRGAGSYRLLRWMEGTLVGTLSQEQRDPENPLEFSSPPRSSERRSAAAGAELRLFGRILGRAAELRGSARGELNVSELRGRQGVEEVRAHRDQESWTRRLGAAFSLAPGLSLSASVGSGRRLPSIAELFGDRATREANLRLRPEASVSSELGLVYRGRGAGLRGQLELRGFGLWIEDLIVLLPTSQWTVRPDNVAEARILGLEAGLRGWLWERLSLQAAATWMDARDVNGQRLPMRPALNLHGRGELWLLRGQALGLFVFHEATVVDFFYVNEGERGFLPSRIELDAGLGASLLDGGLQLFGRVDNYSDRRGTDVLSRPLPGRRVWVGVIGELGD
ncbi:MAG: TonB-dependent receptor [Myxococcales bacterium]|nr:TonB-dependent receptor [Myxococcales bacterium]